MVRADSNAVHAGQLIMVMMNKVHGYDIYIYDIQYKASFID